MAKLFWLQPDNTIVEFPLKAEQSLIGRGSRCDVRIKHPGISAEHAIIRRVSGVATVEDLGSTNGTRVNGKRLAQMHTLRHGDQIGVGRERLMYFAELDSAANFLQPEFIEPFAIPAPIRERVNTESDPGLASAFIASLPPEIAAPMRAAAAKPAPSPAPAPSVPSVPPPPLGVEPFLDVSLLAALPKGTTLASGGPPIVSSSSTHARAVQPAPPFVPLTARAPASHAAPVIPAEPAAASQAPSSAAVAKSPAPTQMLVGSVAVLSGPAAGKRYMLTSASVTLGKEGKQVVEFVRASPTRWQILQREGVTPAYINGDALAGPRELAAGDVIELTGVRLRFEISLTQK